jgi:uncharacterized membrane protein YgcG
MIARRSGLARMAVTVAALLVLLATGCGDTSTPAKTVPELRSGLSRLDHALVGRHYVVARKQLDQLVRTTVTARRAGDLEAEQADQILAAAAALLSAMPKPQPSPERAPRSPVSPSPEGDGAAQDQQRDEELLEELEERRAELQQQREELRQEQEEQQNNEGEGGGEGSGESGGGGSNEGHGS